MSCKIGQAIPHLIDHALWNKVKCTETGYCLSSRIRRTKKRIHEKID
jgi:hypothetical protein